MKVCTKCKFDYPAPLEDYFSKKSKAIDGFQDTCKSCHSVYIKQHYVDNTSYYKSKASKSKKIRRREAMRFVVDYLKEHPCVDCGEIDPVVLEFDHLKDKTKAISMMIRDGLSNETIAAEIEKCEVRCANCHRRKTSKQFSWYKDIVI